MGSPRFVGGLDYGVGTCTTGGFSARPSGYTCAVSLSFFRSFSLLGPEFPNFCPSLSPDFDSLEEHEQCQDVETC